MVEVCHWNLNEIINVNQKPKKKDTKPYKSTNWHTLSNFTFWFISQQCKIMMIIITITRIRYSTIHIICRWGCHIITITTSYRWFYIQPIGVGGCGGICSKDWWRPFRFRCRTRCRHHCYCWHIEHTLNTHYIHIERCRLSLWSSRLDVEWLQLQACVPVILQLFSVPFTPND